MIGRSLNASWKGGTKLDRSCLFVLTAFIGDVGGESFVNISILQQAKVEYAQLK
ncbi:MAG: hypothetical protein WBC04_00305 [Candidatus Acidiferrales bacterium]